MAPPTRPLTKGEGYPDGGPSPIPPLRFVARGCGGPLPSQASAMCWSACGYLYRVGANVSMEAELEKWCRAVGGFLERRGGEVVCWLGDVGVGVGEVFRVVDRRYEAEMVLPYPAAEVRFYETPSGMKCFGSLPDKREVPQLFVCVYPEKRRGFYFFYRPRKFGVREVVKRDFTW